MTPDQGAPAGDQTFLPAGAALPGDGTRGIGAQLGHQRVDDGPDVVEMMGRGVDVPVAAGSRGGDRGLGRVRAQSASPQQNADCRRQVVAAHQPSARPRTGCGESGIELDPRLLEGTSESTVGDDLDSVMEPVNAAREPVERAHPGGRGARGGHGPAAAEHGMHDLGGTSAGSAHRSMMGRNRVLWR